MRTLCFETLEPRWTPTPFLTTCDVDHDGRVDATDALIVTNHVNAQAGYRINRDVNQDGIVSPLDVLLVVNWVNRYGAGPYNAEGEQRAATINQVFAGETPAQGSLASFAQTFGSETETIMLQVMIGGRADGVTVRVNNELCRPDAFVESAGIGVWTFELYTRGWTAVTVLGSAAPGLQIVAIIGRTV